MQLAEGLGPKMLQTLITPFKIKLQHLKTRWQAAASNLRSLPPTKQFKFEDL